MARNSSGTMSQTNGPYINGTTADASLLEARLDDIEAELTDSVCRSNKGALLAVLRHVAGTVAAPAVTFDVDTDCGLYRIGANNIGVAVNGAKVLDVATTGLTVTGALAITGALTGAATTPVAVTTNANITAGNGLAYWKSPDGVVHVKGKVTNATGGTTQNIVTTTPLPAGFRSSFDRVFTCSDGNGTRMYHVVVASTGAITVISDTAGNAGLLNGATAYLDPIQYLGEA